MNRALQRPRRNNSVMKALIAVGSNLSDRGKLSKSIVAEAIDSVVSRTGHAAQVSRFYRTPAFPPGSGPSFVNAAFAVDWSGNAETLLSLLHEVEADFRRARDMRWAARTLDLDLIALGDMVCPDETEQTRWRRMPLEQAATVAPDRLILPHPRMQERAFVLVPLCEVAPDWRHPLTGRSVREMRDALPRDALAEIRPLDAD